MSNMTRKHGGSKTLTYSSWKAMRGRCLNPSHRAYRDYGGRGITVCPRWLSYETFLADMGERPSPQHSLDRFPNRNGNYEPGNCRWANNREQHINKRNNRRLTYDGRTMTLTEWAEEVGISRITIRSRLVAGWSVADALTLAPSKVKLRNR